MNRKATNVIKYLLSVGLAAVLVWFAFKGVDWKAFLDGLKETRWGYVLIFTLVSVLALFFREERWRVMMEPLDPNVKMLDAWDASNVGNIVNVVLPGAGEFVRGGYIRSKKMGYDKIMGTIVCERAWDVISVLLMLIFALVLKWDTFGSFFIANIWNPLTHSLGFSMWWIIAPILLALAGFIWGVFHWESKYEFCAKVAGTIRGLGTGIASFVHIRRKWAFVLYTLGIWITYLLMTYYNFLAIPALAHLTFFDSIFVSAVGNIASVIPVPGGLGAYHYLVALTLESIYGATWETSLLFATLSHETHALLLIILGIVSYVRLTVRLKPAKGKAARMNKK